MRLREKIVTQFQLEDGDTIQGIIEFLQKAPTGYPNLPIRLLGDGAFEVEQPLQ